MFWIGTFVGMMFASIVLIGFMLFCCWKTYGDVDTFMDMVDVVVAANENRESEVRVYHDGDILEVAVFEERE